MQQRFSAENTTRVGEHRYTVSASFSQLSPPVIIIGMHRSGTSMVAGMLHMMGAFVDPHLDADISTSAPPGEIIRRNGYGEAVAFRLVNEAIMSRAGAVWNDVNGFLAKRDDETFHKASIREIAAATGSILKTEFLDGAAGVRPRVWGWKDPRTSLTLPYWLELFPQARLLYVRRDPAGIIDSLQRRELANAARSAVTAPPSTAQRLKSVASNPQTIVRGLRRRLGILPTNVLPSSYDDWLKLTLQYTSECEKYRNHSGGFLEVSFEDILRDPIANANAIADFTQTCAPLNQILRAANFVLVDRK